MIQYLKNEDIDRRKWDEAIARSFNGIVYAYSWYLDIVSPKWHALIKDDYKSIMPLTWRNKFGINYLYQPFFTQQLGVFSSEKSDADLVQQFLKAIPAHFKFAEINLNTFNQSSSSEFSVKSNLTHELDLIESYENISKNYSDNLKRNLKKAVANKLNYVFDSQAEPVIKMFRESNRAAASNLKSRDYKVLSQLIEWGTQRGKVQVVNVTSEQHELCGGAFFVQSNNKVIFLFSGLNEKGKELGAMPFLLDSFIKQNAGKNITLDFEGSNDANLARFYKSFGSKECVYQQVKINRLPMLFRWLKN